MLDLVRSPRMAGDLVRKARRARGWTQVELEAGEPGTRMEVFFDALTALGLELVVSVRGGKPDFGEMF